MRVIQLKRVVLHNCDILMGLYYHKYTGPASFKCDKLERGFKSAVHSFVVVLRIHVTENKIKVNMY